MKTSACSNTFVLKEGGGKLLPQGGGRTAPTREVTGRPVDIIGRFCLLDLETTKLSIGHKFPLAPPGEDGRSFTFWEWRGGNKK